MTTNSFQNLQGIDKLQSYFEKLYASKSMSGMDYFIEERCLPATAGDTMERELFLTIYRSNDLDERQLICAEYLGLTREAQELRDWIAKKNARSPEGRHAQGHGPHGAVLPLLP